MSKKNIFIILGMHRSGTSALARALQVFDIDLGHNLMAASSGENEKGFFEDLDIYNLNEEILSFLNLTWDTNEPLSDSDIIALRNSGYFEKGVELIRTKLLTCKYAIGFKDPRISILIRFWNEVFSKIDANVKYIMAIRNPMAIIRSLEKRNYIFWSRGLAITLNYMVEPIRVLGEDNICFVHYEDLLVEPRAQLEKCSDFTGLKINENEYKVYAENFLEKNLNHFEQGEKKLIPYAYENYIDAILNSDFKKLLILEPIQDKDIYAFNYENEKIIVNTIDEKNKNIESLNNDKLKYESELTSLQSELDLIKNSKTFKAMRFIAKVLGR